MRSFPSSEFKRSLGDVLDAASREPVAITRHSKARFVLMSVEAYEQRFPKDPRAAFAVEEMPADHLEMLMAALSEEPPK